jgi:hypothetical protein
MTTTPHDATTYTSPAQASPAETKAMILAEVQTNRDDHKREFKTAVDMYRARVGIADPIPAGYPGPTATVNSIKEWVAGTVDYEAWQNEVETNATPVGTEELNRAQYAYAQELANQNRVTLLNWLEQIPGVEG